MIGLVSETHLNQHRIQNIRVAKETTTHPFSLSLKNKMEANKKW